VSIVSQKDKNWSYKFISTNAQIEKKRWTDLIWPGVSPDLNYIENVWISCNMQLEKKRTPGTLKELEGNLNLIVAETRAFRHKEAVIVSKGSNKQMLLNMPATFFLC